MYRTKKRNCTYISDPNLQVRVFGSRMLSAVRRLMAVLMLALAWEGSAQTTVVMPHQGRDTLYISSTGCYTILDPGGTGKYQNNEDSYLCIIGTEPFYLECNYELGHTDDGKDWVQIFQDTVDWYGYNQLGGIGQQRIHFWSTRALVHFHSNAYNTFDGFELKVLHQSTVYNLSDSTLPAGNAVRLSWEDSRYSASLWTIEYTWNDDTLLTAYTPYKNITLNGLLPNRSYRYTVKNNVVGCSYNDYAYFTSRQDSSILIMRQGDWGNDTLPPTRCYSIKGPTGDSASMELDYSAHQYYFNQGHGVYLRGTYRILSGEVSTERLSPWSTFGEYNYHWEQSAERSYEGWFPKGYVRTISAGRSRFNFDVLPENDAYITPTVTALTATSATISWTDAMASTSYTVRYCSTEGQWSQLTTTAPTVTLTGLQPGRQYVYTIEGNTKRLACDVPARFAFITAGGPADTILMPYRGTRTVTIEPRHCYVVTDGGGSGSYFNTDFSTLVIKSANHKGFRLKGQCLLDNNDRLAIYNGVQNWEQGGNNYDIEIATAADSIVIHFLSDTKVNGPGFVLEVLQADDSITGLHTVAVGTTAATIAWTDASGATSWTVHYGLSEEAMQTMTVGTPTATIGGLQPGTQYVYYVTNGTSDGSCLFSERKAFVTQGLAPGNILMSFRSIDTLVLQQGTCYHIWDAGGTDHNYFNNDTSYLILISSDGSDFTIDGQWLFGGNEAQYNNVGYDSYDRLGFKCNPDDTYFAEADGWYNRFANNDRMRYSSCNGYLCIRFTSNSRRTSQGFCLTVDWGSATVADVRLTRVLPNAATVTWSDNSDASSWTVAYGPVGSTMATATTTVRNFAMINLLPSTDYEVKVYSGTTAPCNVPSTFFTTLEANAIVMSYRGDDTVLITPGQCYYVYDPGGTGNYLPSDSSRLVIRSTTGEGFYYNISISVGQTDMSDEFYITDNGRGQYWWGWDTWVHNGELTIELNTNEAIQDRGFWMSIRFPSRAMNPDTLNMTDSTVTITWQDTTAATQWNFSYGTHIDSMTTVTTGTRQYTMTGLERNRQYFYSIYNTTENQECVLENIYGVIMPTDAGTYIDPYRNYYLNRAGRYAAYQSGDITLTPDQCYRFLDDGALGRLLYNSDNNFSFHTSNNQGLTLEGYYNLGSSSIWISTSLYGAWYGGSGYLNIYAPDGYINFQQRVGTSPTDFAEGFNFDVTFNHKIYNVRTQNVTCTSATLRWDDSTSATQWTVAYGPTEKELDTLTVSTKILALNGLLPDHQYVCYISSNDNTLPCLKPVKYCFITTCDTTIFVIPYNCDTTRILDINSCYTIRDGGSTRDYLYNDHHMVYLQSSNGGPITLRGDIDMSDNDYLYVLDDITGEWIGSYGRQDNVVMTIPSGRVRLEYNVAGDTTTGTGFEFSVSFHTISNIQVSLKTDTSCRLTWDDNSGATQWICHYGLDKKQMDSVVCDQRVAHLGGLVYGKRYYVFFSNNSVACIDTTWFEFCAGGDKCIDFGDIYSCFATAYYGRFNNPIEYRGLVDYGPDDINSRHTVIDDTLATDPRTGNLLRCVPPGHYEAVRLGNWDIGGEAESITYEYDVDTTKSEILLLRYAAVLENPRHSPSMQPRFTFDIVDENNNLIDAQCYSADFVSSDSLGWNLYQYDTNTVLWKDWTAIGIDLAPLHGRRIYFRLTTYDCNEMGHFGYAYFTLECEEKEIQPNECGVVHANTFTAPEGFRYEWFNIDSANVILSTQRTFHSSQNGIYKCRGHFLGNTGNNCYFEKTAIVGDIFPFANFTYEIIDTNGCDVVVQFHNHSCASLDPEGTQQTAMECDGFTWNFGDGTTSNEKHPIHQFPSREFRVSLLASLANGTCTDDTVQTILMRSPCISFDTVYAEMCQGETFVLRDSVFTTTGQYAVRTEYRADSIVTTFVHLTVHHTLDTNILGGICDGNSYTLFGFNEDIEGDYVHAFTSVHGCDSIYRLHLEVATSYDTVVTRHGCTSSGFLYRDTTFYTSTIYTDSLLSIYSCDSVVTMNITITPSYYNEHFDTICEGDTFYFPDYPYPFTYSTTIRFSTTTAAGCDSTDVFNLQVNDTYLSMTNEHICHNQTYSYGGQQYGEGLIVDSLLTVNGCDSVVRINVIYFDTTFRADALLSIDTISWTRSGSMLYACQPLTLYGRDISLAHASVQWLFGDGATSSQPNPVHTYTDDGIFDVRLIAKSPDGCLDTATIINAVQVLPLPVADFSWSPLTPSNVEPTTSFINLSTPNDTANRYLWYFYTHSADEEPADSSILPEPQYTWPDDDQVGSHDVTLFLDRYFTTLRGNRHVCSDTVTKAINVVNTYLQFPNVVTPNGDGHNDIWQVVNLVEFNLYPVNRLRIYNRWGRLVFKRDNISSHSDDWDPNDCDCPDGTYFYRFDAQGEYGFIQHNGAIEVIRK